MAWTDYAAAPAPGTPVCKAAQVKGVLRDQSVVAGIGNAYSDEILHAARLSPFHPCTSLTEEEIAALHASIRRTLTDAIERASGEGTGTLKAEKKLKISRADVKRIVRDTSLHFWSKSWIWERFHTLRRS